MNRYNFANFLLLGFCLGPLQQKDLDSFLILFIDKLDLLTHRVSAYDIETKSSFLLKVHLVFLSGDRADVSKLLHLCGHIAKYPC